MSSKNRKNCIINGLISSYCLACDCQLDSFDEIYSHIGLEEHKKNLVKYPYLEKFGDNNIRKMKMGYYCEYCSTLLSTAAQVNMHITNPSHRDCRGSQMLTKHENNVIAFNRILIKENAWHSVTEDTCAICNIEFDDHKQHIIETSHLLKLVQSRVQFGVNGELFRKLDESTFQCVTCNQVYALNNTDEHFVGEDHKNQYAICEKQLKEININKKTVKEKEKKVDVKVKQEKINQSVKPDKNQNNPKDVNLNEVKATPTNEGDDRVDFAKENNLTYNADNANCYCRLCEKKFPSTLRSMKEHVSGKEHTNKFNKNAEKNDVKTAAPKPKVTKKKSVHFFEYLIYFENDFGDFCVLSETICISAISFMMFIENEQFLRCQLCEVNIYDIRNVDAHLDTDKHSKLMKEMPVVTSLDNEFIREIRTSVFHCGYCNLVIPCWVDVERHLKSNEHMCVKGKYQRILEMARPSLPFYEQRMRQEVAYRVFEKQLKEININKQTVTEKENKVDVKVKQEKINQSVKPDKNQNKAEDVNVNEVKATTSNDGDDRVDFAKENNLTYNADNANCYCRLCEKKFPSTLRSMKEHVSGKDHTNKSNKNAEKNDVKTAAPKPKVTKKKSQKFIENLFDMETAFGHFCVLNETICISPSSFMTLTENEQFVRCQVCENMYDIRNINAHINTDKHLMLMKEMPVVTSLDNEFIREIRTSVFHCGYCNLVIPCWVDVERHLKSDVHVGTKEKCKWILEMARPSLHEQRMRQELACRVFLSALCGRRY